MLCSYIEKKDRKLLEHNEVNYNQEKVLIMGRNVNKVGIKIVPLDFKHGGGSKEHIIKSLLQAF